VWSNPIQSFTLARNLANYVNYWAAVDMQKLCASLPPSTNPQLARAVEAAIFKSDLCVSNVLHPTLRIGLGS
jgi:hypothetical protein